MSIEEKRRGSHFVYLIYMNYNLILSHLALFSPSHTATVAFNMAKNNNNNNNKEIVRASRTTSSGCISLKHYYPWVSRTQNTNVLPSISKFSTISDPCSNLLRRSGLVEESLHA